MAANAELTRRFEREAITAANLRYPNVVIIYDAGSHENLKYIVMEYLDGPTLQQEIQKKSSLSINRAIPITRQLASALDYAHPQGLVRRDVKRRTTQLDIFWHLRYNELCPGDVAGYTGCCSMAAGNSTTWRPFVRGKPHTGGGESSPHV